MQQTSAAWKALWAAGANLETVAEIGGVKYAVTSAPAISRALMQGGLSIGNAVSATCSFSLRTEAIIPKSAKVRIKARLNNGTTASEWLPMGTYYISRRSRDVVTGLLTLECYDALLKANANMPVFLREPWTTNEGTVITTNTGEIMYFAPAVSEESTGTAEDDTFYPCPMSRMAAILAQAIGVEIDPRTRLETGSAYIIEKPDDGATVRDVLCKIAAAHGGNWIITPEERLRLVPMYGNADAVAVVAVLGAIGVESSGTVTGVRYNLDNEPVLIGDDTGIVVDADVSGAVVYDLYNKLHGVQYQSYTLNGAIYDPAAELGDAIGAGSGGEIMSRLCVENATLGPLYTGDISAPESDELGDEYPYISKGTQAINLLRIDIRALEDAAIVSVDVEYAQNQSTTTAPTSGWSTAAPAWRDGYYIWQRTATTTGSGTTYSEPTCISGRNGEDGQDGQDGTSVTIMGSYDTLAELEAAHPTANTGDGYMVGGDLYVWNGTAWENVGRIQGPEGPAGPTGQTGETGIGVSGIVEEYYLSTSSTTQKGGSWSTAQPIWGNGLYIWTRSAVTWTDGNTTYTTPVLAKAINGANQEAANANTRADSANSAAEQANTTANNALSAVNTLNNDLDQKGVFNRLTNNGQDQGIYLYNGKIYINGTYMQIGTITGASGENYWVLDGANAEFVANKGKIGDFLLENGSMTYGTPEEGGNGLRLNKDGFYSTYFNTYGPATDPTRFAALQYGSLRLGIINGGYCALQAWNGTEGGFRFAITYNGSTRYPISVDSTDGSRVIKTGVAYPVSVLGGMTVERGMSVSGGLTVTGTKSRQVSTGQYSDRLLYCYETPSPLFGDVGEGVIGEDGLCYIWLDAVFAQTISTDNYQVFLQRYGAGDCWVAERRPGCFIVEGESGLRFGWEIKAKQRDFDQRRLDSAEPPYTPTSTDYGALAAAHINDIRQERELV